MPVMNTEQDSGGRPRSAECGTPSGYTSHYYHGERPCEACKDAHREYRRAWRKAKAVAK